MIKILQMHIEEFRGIRDLTIDLGGRSFVVSGPNGSGKSGVVDSIEFALTGEISRLKGVGTGSLTVAQHAPHILSAGNPGASKVTLVIEAPVSGQIAQLERSVTSPRILTLTPDTPEMRAAVDLVSEHPELTLSRRQITQYIIAEPSRRSQQVQALLKLEKLEKVRTLLRSVKTKTETVQDSADSAVVSERTKFLTQVDQPHFDGPSALATVNTHRIRLGLESIEALSAEADLAHGIVDAADPNQIDKESALRDVDALLTAIASLADFTESLAGLRECVAKLEATPNGLLLLQTEELVTMGSSLVTGPICPLCDAEWSSEEELRAHLEEKLTLTAEVSSTKTQLMTYANAIASLAVSHRGQVSAVQRNATTLGLDAIATNLSSAARVAGEVSSNLRKLNGAIAYSTSEATSPIYFSDDLTSDLRSVRDQIVAIPDQSDRQQSTRFLSIAQERWSRWQAALAEATLAKHVSDSADAAYQIYCDCQESALQGLYHAVETEVSEFYRIVNGNDEAEFRVELRPSEGSLDLLVDFYGHGLFPPGAYHSEGHQDGMGVCLYLALMSQILGDEFSFAVLDDVVMSVDQAHRRQFCELLKSRFPKVQFIITTHDPVWTRQIVKSSVVPRENVLRFVNWSVEGGPVTRQYEDLWARIDSLLDVNEVSQAAWVLRNGMEMACDEIADELRASIPYKSSSQYDLGEMTSGINGRHGSLLKKAADSANRWSNQPAADHVEALKAARTAAVIAQQDESWPVNLLVHYNPASPMSVEDFRPVLEAWKKYIGLFHCSNPACAGSIFIEGLVGTETSLRCRCGEFNLNVTLPT